ncbi:hypothetical protein HN358_01215 [Candidatus Uhrbacteria bacterium]|nr:hypothetical protein [Candidatus Uhrbacteria bacterium]MBT7717348.1 hypothetical protein [Candidatus Uhrbacteria bacterium]
MRDKQMRSKYFLKTSLAIFVLVVISSFGSLKQAIGSADCWNIHMVDQYALCSQADLQCSYDCMDLGVQGDELYACWDACEVSRAACTAQAIADHSACVYGPSEPEPEAVEIIEYAEPEIEVYELIEEPVATEPEELEEEVIVQEPILEPALEILETPEQPELFESEDDLIDAIQSNEEYQEAQAELAGTNQYDVELITGDVFGEDVVDALDQVKQDLNLTPEQEKTADDYLQMSRSGLETIQDMASRYKDISEFNDTIELIKKGEHGKYNKLGLLTDTVKTLVDYADMRDKGVSVENATAKATMDNFGTSLVTLIPVLKAIDVVATTPDAVMGYLGIDKDNFIRKYITAGFIKKFAPSDVIKETTNLMIQDDWSDIGNALTHGWNQVVDAEGFVDTTFESGKLLAGSLGAAAVASVSVVRDVGTGVVYIADAVVGFVGNIFSF